MNPAESAAATFRQEAQDLLDQLEQALLDLDQHPDEREIIDSAFRALHTIKGSGSMFGFEQVAEFTHSFETAFEHVRKGSAQLSPRLVALALAAKDHIRLLIERPADADAGEAEAILRELAAITSQRTVSAAPDTADPGMPAYATADAPGAAEPVLSNGGIASDGIASDGVETWRVRFRLPRNALLNGTNPLLLLDELRELGPCAVRALTDAIPPLEEMEPDGCYLGWEVILDTSGAKAAIEEVFLFVMDDAELSIERIEDEGPASASEPEPESGSEPTPGARPERTETDVTLGEDGDDAGSSCVAPQPNATDAADPQATTTAAQPFVKRDGEGRRATDKGSTTSLRVPAERLDELMDRVGELVIAQARLSQLAESSADVQVKSVAEEIERLSSALRDTTMGIRMVPIGTLFGRFRRLVHDLSRDLGKRVDLVMVGEDTELDKTMIERLADPLVHLIRNAIDHGLETPDQRSEAGKPHTGQVRLIARYAGAEVLVTIADDGKGMDHARIRAKAEEQGLIQPGAAIADHDLLQLLFHPGFSTAREISAISGRGVGMDVVKRTIDALRGTIDVTTTPGQGSSVTLRLPLTLAIIDGLLVRVGAGRYVIPLSAVEECVELSSDDDARSQHRSFMNIRGELVPFVRLRELFTSGSPPDPHQKVVVVTAADLRVGLVVDQIIGSHQTVIKSLSKLHADVEAFSGATILGDGTVALILDIAHLVELGQENEARAKAVEQEAA
jgi:Chemotaxis protein histidine kinase and related kinases